MPNTPEARKLIRENLPHRYGFKWYDWAWKFFKSKNRMNLLVAGNQLSKSSTQIRKCIEWCTNTSLWPELWPKNPVPRNVWYLYPDSKVATIELETKWIPEFMPRGVFKDHPVFGYDIVYDKRRIEKIVWKNGVQLHFKTYMQNPASLQSSTVHAIFCDEELPEHIYDELQFRLAGTDGHFHMVFTATLGQEMWWRAMEGSGEQEKFPQAFKQQVSMYDCVKYMDGSPGAFNERRIQKIIKTCKSQNEVLKRVYGRFVSDSGRKYPAFDPGRHFVTPFPIEPGKWHLYGGVDPGGGGQTGHPAAMGIIAVRSDFRLGYVVRGYRMDGVDTTSGDILAKFREMRGAWTLRNQFYDQASKDFNMVASRAGESFTKSEKSHELGEDIINTLFKNDMLFVFDTPELRKLGQELVTLRTDTVKRKAKDDFIDGAVRYPCTSIPWDWTVLQGDESEEEIARKAAKERPLTKEEYDAFVNEQRRGSLDAERRRRNKSPSGPEWRQWEEETQFWNDQYGS